MVEYYSVTVRNYCDARPKDTENIVLWVKSNDKRTVARAAASFVGPFCYVHIQKHVDHRLVGYFNHQFGQDTTVLRRESSGDVEKVSVSDYIEHLISTNLEG